MTTQRSNGPSKVIRSFRIVAALAAISLGACGPRQSSTPIDTKITPTDTSKRTFDVVAYDDNDGSPDAQVFRDRLTGCEIVVFVYNGLTSYPRMEPDAVGEGRHQRCTKSKPVK